MLETVKLENILFLDIETAPFHERYEHLSLSMKEHWDHKTQVLKLEGSGEENFQRAGIYAEFGRIVCISVGCFKKTDGKQAFHLKSFSGEDEKKILQDFSDLLNKRFAGKENSLCGHNAKEFDYPYINRRLIINGMKLPVLLDISGRKPWEVTLFDTMELWKFGDYKSYTSLDLLANVLGIPSPKDDISGKDIANVFWMEKDFKRISHYCRKDVLTVAQIFLRLKGEPLLTEAEVFEEEDRW